jgi:hypothetical protein
LNLHGTSPAAPNRPTIAAPASKNAVPATVTDVTAPTGPAGGNTVSGSKSSSPACGPE